MANTNTESIDNAGHFLEDKGFVQPAIGMILGTGFGRFTESLEVEHRIGYDRIPGFPVSTVAQHAGNLVFARYKDVRLVIMQGRIHRYEGYSVDQVTFPVRVIHRLGARMLVVTNAAGGLNRNLHVGDLMNISDHIDMMGGFPSSGTPDSESDACSGVPSTGPGTRGPVYDSTLRGILTDAAAAVRIPLRSGVLSSMLGPSFETPAELAMLRRFGADAVSMSTVPEVKVASQLNMRIAGVSCISNMCVGDEPLHVDHEDVAVVVDEAVGRFASLMIGMLDQIDLQECR